MIVGLEFDADDNLVTCRLFCDDPHAGRRWVRVLRLKAGHSRSLYDVSGQGLARGAAASKIASRALRQGVLLADRDPRVRAA